MVGGAQSPGSLRQLHEESSWEGQEHVDRCTGGDRWVGAPTLLCPWPSGTSALPPEAPGSPHWLSDQPSPSPGRPPTSDFH